MVSLVSSGLSAYLQALSHRRDVASLTFHYKYYDGKCSSDLPISYLPNVSLLEALAFLSRCIIIQLILLCARLKFYQSSFFPCTAALWYSLNNECLLPDYDLTAFKGWVTKFLLLIDRPCCIHTVNQNQVRFPFSLSSP